MRQTLVKRNGFWLVLALIFALISGIGASLVQTAGGNVKVDDLRWETASGRTLNALLFTPPNATADTPAPGIVVSHGWWNNREMQTPNYVELARRGYVVMSIDMYGHGNSDPLPADELMVGGTGMYDAVLQMAELPYVDSDAIGVTGHSNGARAANFSIPLDDAAPKQLISSVLLVDFDPIYTDADGAYANAYGTRDVGLIQAQYDEFFFRSYDADGAQLTVPRDYLTTPNAQSFLNFGADPADGEQREGTTVYTQSVDGTEAIASFTPCRRPTRGRRPRARRLGTSSTTSMSRWAHPRPWAPATRSGSSRSSSPHSASSPSVSSWSRSRGPC